MGLSRNEVIKLSDKRAETLPALYRERPSKRHTQNARIETRRIRKAGFMVAIKTKGYSIKRCFTPILLIRNNHGTCRSRKGRKCGLPKGGYFSVSNTPFSHFGSSDDVRSRTTCISFLHHICGGTYQNVKVVGTHYWKRD